MAPPVFIVKSLKSAANEILRLGLAELLNCCTLGYGKKLQVLEPEVTISERYVR